MSMTPNKTTQPKSSARRRFLKTAAVGAAAIVGTPAYASEIEPEHLEVVHREVKIAGWPTSAAGMQIGQLSDLHCENDRAVARTKRAAQLLLSLALLLFVATVLVVLFSVHAMRLGPIGVTTLIAGLIAVAAAIGLELYEIGLARLTVAGELADIFTKGSP